MTDRLAALTRHFQVSIIPVIGKSDSCTRQELATFKERVRTQLQDHQIDTFNFHSDEILPFAVVGSNVLVEDGEGGKVRGRKYPWGTVNIEDPAHSDFLSLRRLILCQHMLVNTAAQRSEANISVCNLRTSNI